MADRFPIVHKGWEVTRDAELRTVNVTPRNDAKEHIDVPACECAPRTEEFKGYTLVIHNAFDGREVREKKEGVN